VPDEDGEQNVVVDNPLKVIVERQCGFDVSIFEIGVLARMSKRWTKEKLIASRLNTFEGQQTWDTLQ
jgi:hypothetical protein